MTMLADSELVRLGISDGMREALALARSMKKTGARKRQLKFCGQRLQAEELDDVKAFLLDRHSTKVEVNRKFHELEKLREKLIEEGDKVVHEVVNQYPSLDRQRIRQLVREAQKEAHKAAKFQAGYLVTAIHMQMHWGVNHYWHEMLSQSLPFSLAECLHDAVL